MHKKKKKIITNRRTLMGCRRKLKKERELVADIGKTFKNFCHQQDCRDCPYRHSEDCLIDYIKDLLQKYDKAEEEE